MKLAASLLFFSPPLALEKPLNFLTNFSIWNERLSMEGNSLAYETTAILYFGIMMAYFPIWYISLRKKGRKKPLLTLFLTLLLSLDARHHLYISLYQPQPLTSTSIFFIPFRFSLLLLSSDTYNPSTKIMCEQWKAKTRMTRTIPPTYILYSTRENHLQ